MEFLKIAVLNNSGNVGKSTICQTLLMPRIDGAELVKIETINSDNSNDKGMSAKDMVTVINKIDSFDKAVIDIGSSNIENFISGMRKNEGAHEDIDFYLIPTTPESKQQTDTINTINDLMDMGVPAESIRIIFNKADEDSSIESQFSLLLQHQISKKVKLTDFSNHIVIFETPIFSLLEKTGQKFIDVVNDKADYKALIRSEKDIDKRSILSLRRSALRLSKGYQRNLDVAFKKLSLVS